MRRRLSRAGLAIAAAVAALFPVLVAPPALADTVYLQVWWIRCDDQSEPFSDEIRLRFQGSFIGGWNDVDGGETHWYWSSMPFYGTPLNRSFSGNVALDIIEQDSSYDLIGYLGVSESEVGTGPHERSANMYDGRYTVRYEVTANPV
jgi:hypothetical protein